MAPRLVRWTGWKKFGSCDQSLYTSHFMIFGNLAMCINSYYDLNNHAPLLCGTLKLNLGLSLNLLPFLECKMRRLLLLPSAESFMKGCCQLQAKVCARLLVNCLLKLAQEKSVVRWTDRLAMTIAVDLGRKATKPTNQLVCRLRCLRML